MKQNKFRIIFWIVAVFGIVAVVGGFAIKTINDSTFSNWKKNSEPLALLKSYVNEVTDEKRANYINPEDRIAIFDMDGTLMCEKFKVYFEWLMFAHRVLDDPNYNYKATPKEIELANGIRALGPNDKIPENFEKDEAELGGHPYEGMTLYEYYYYVKDFMKTKAEGFNNMQRGYAFYEPMIDIVHYLEDNDFLIYICSGTDRICDRAIIEETFPEIPVSQIIGMDYDTKAKGQGDKDDLNYTYKPAEKLIRTSDLIQKNVKMNKVIQIAQQIGKIPVLAFGNSTGDSSMLNLTIENQEKKSMSFIIKCDDLEREYGNLETAEKVQKLADQYG